VESSDSVAIPFCRAARLERHEDLVRLRAESLRGLRRFLTEDHMNAVQEWWIIAKVRSENWWSLRFRAGMSLMRWGWRCWRGKALIMEAREVSSNGGYRYLQLNLTYSPVSKAHRYLKDIE